MNKRGSRRPSWPRAVGQPPGLGGAARCPSGKAGRLPPRWSWRAEDAAPRAASPSPPENPLLGEVLRLRRATGARGEAGGPRRPGVRKAGPEEARGHKARVAPAWPAAGRARPHVARDRGRLSLEDRGSLALSLPWAHGAPSPPPLPAPTRRRRIAVCAPGPRRLRPKTGHCEVEVGEGVQILRPRGHCRRSASSCVPNRHTRPASELSLSLSPPSFIFWLHLSIFEKSILKVLTFPEMFRCRNRTCKCTTFALSYEVSS